MQFRSIPIALMLCLLAGSRTSAQNVTTESIDLFIKGQQAERAELSSVEDKLDELNEKIRKFRECEKLMGDAGEVTGGRLGGLAAKAAMRAKCGATSDEGFLKDRAKLLEGPEKAGATAAGLKPKDYSKIKELALLYLGGSRNFSPGDLQVFAARATDLANAMGVALAAAGGGDSGASGGGSRIGNAIGNAVGARLRMFTPDMTWAYVSYLWGIMYMSGATMFETEYKPGQWTSWEVKDASQQDTKLVLERALLSREADGSEWWRTKSISIGPEGTDTINFEVQFKPQGEGVQQVVRMRGKMPGDTEPKELMVPQHLTTLSPSAFAIKPTKESIAGATIGTESVKTSTGTYSAKHIKFGSGGGNMEWWVADNAPGSVVRVQWSGNQPDQKWTMEMTGAGTGAKSELGVR